MINEISKMPEKMAEYSQENKSFSDIKPKHEINMKDASKVWELAFSETKRSADSKADVQSDRVDIKKGLSDSEKLDIRKESGWPAEVIDNIQSYEEYKIYQEAKLQVAEIGEKNALIRNDIAWDQVDEKGRTNDERIERGLAPIDRNGNAIELHHIGQHADSPLAELTFQEHRCDGNYSILHDRSHPTEVHGLGNDWQAQKRGYWNNRASYNKQIA